MREPLVSKEYRALQDRLELPARLALPDRQELRGQKVMPDLRVWLGRLVPRARQDLRDRREFPAMAARPFSLAATVNLYLCQFHSIPCPGP